MASRLMLLKIGITMFSQNPPMISIFTQSKIYFFFFKIMLKAQCNLIPHDVHTSPLSTPCPFCSEHTALSRSLKQAQQAFILGPLHMFFPLPGMLFSWTATWPVPSIPLGLQSKVIFSLKPSPSST